MKLIDVNIISDWYHLLVHISMVYWHIVKSLISYMYSAFLVTDLYVVHVLGPGNIHVLYCMLIKCHYIVTVFTLVLLSVITRSLQLS